MMIVLMIQAIFLAFLSVDQAYSQGTLMINCGGGGNGMWESDDNFIKTGQKSQVREYRDKWDQQMNSLRFFPDQNKNCYTLPAKTQEKYLIQAGFFYGNYDGKFTPPTFDLQFDGNHWATVYATGESPSFKEAIVFAKRENISVCVARTLLYNQIPFISTLVLVYLPSTLLYKRMDGGNALVLENRVNFGSPYNIWFPGDIYSRLWFLGVSPIYKNVTALEPRNLGELDDHPPSLVMTSTIEAPNPSESMIFCFILDEKNRLVYVNLYFTEAKASRKKRTFDVYINGENMNLDLFLQYEMGTEISLSPARMTSLFNLTLTPREGSILPPTISGLELFSVIEELANGTSFDDVQGLEKLISNWENLKGWTGDPCLPSYSAWDWISCDDQNPPRVICLNLASYGLEGQIIDFSQMQALEMIDLHNNSLSGDIPDFLGRLPNLEILNLADNQFSGIVPKSIINNKKVELNITGNSQLRYRGKKKNISLVVGASVAGASLFLVGCILLIVLPKLKTGGETEESAVEQDDIPQEARSGTTPRREDDPVTESNDQFEEVSEEFRKLMEINNVDLLARTGQYSNEQDSD